MGDFMKKIISAICIVCLVLTCSAVNCVYTKAQNYEVIDFSGDEAEYAEFIHMLFAKIVYDDLDGYKNKTVKEYVDDHPDYYDKEIWEDSGITYNAMYNSFIGDYRIHSICNKNDKSGFYAVTFIRGDEVIMAFRGSDSILDSFFLDESNDWVNTDFRFALLNELSSQFEDAGLYINKTINHFDRKLKTYDMTFAGHSLGGALVAYASMTTGIYGYSFDGACGHVIDVIFYNNYLEISPDFAGADKMNFCNYTDEKGYPAADIIQHTHAKQMFQIDRETNLEGLNEYTALPKYSTAGSHIIWSTLGHDGNTVYLTPKVDAGEDGYTYSVDGEIKIDMMDNVNEISSIIFEFITAGVKKDYQAIIETLTGTIKNRRVIVAGSAGGKIDANSYLSIIGGYRGGSVIYGGSGDDSLYGSKYSDILVAGTGCDYLCGEEGSDTYVIDANPEGSLTIEDTEGKSVIILRNMGIRTINKLALDDNGIKLPNGQYVELRIDDVDNIVFFGYDNGRTKKLGYYKDIN